MFFRTRLFHTQLAPDYTSWESCTRSIPFLSSLYGKFNLGFRRNGSRAVLVLHNVMHVRLVLCESIILALAPGPLPGHTNISTTTVVCILPCTTNRALRSIDVMLTVCKHPKSSTNSSEALQGIYKSPPTMHTLQGHNKRHGSINLLLLIPVCKAKRTYSSKA